MLSIEHCKKVLHKNGKQYKDEEIHKLRAVLYQFAQMDYKIFKKEDCNGKERNNIYQSIN